MISLERKKLLRDRARARVTAQQLTKGLGRTQQALRSSIQVAGEEVALDGVLTGSVDTVVAVDEHADDLSWLDDDQVDSFDAIVNAGDAGDIESVLAAQESTPDLIEDWELAVANDESAHLADMSAIETIQVVEEAHAAADQAVADALKAQQTADGKNTIYAQPINPVAPPEKPFVNADLWYRTVEVDGQTRIADVNMWNGTEWKPYQVVASSLLVPGSVGNVLIQDGAIDAKKMTVDALYGKVLRGNEIYGALIDGSVIRLNGLTDTTTLVSDNGATLTSWEGLNGTTLATDTTVYETGSRSIRGARLVGSNYGVKRTFGFTTAALTAWFRVRVPVETTFVAVLNRYNDDTFTEEAAIQSTTYVVPANTWTWVTVTSNATTARLRWRSASLQAVGAQPANVWIDRFNLVAAADDQRSIEISRATGGSPNIFGYGTTRQQRFSLSTGTLDAAGGQPYGMLHLMQDDTERKSAVTPFGISWGNRSGGALHGFIYSTETYDGDLTLSAQGKNIRALSVIDATRGMKAAAWLSPWNDNKTAGFWYGNSVYAGDPPGSGWVLMTITKHESQGLVIQEARRSATPTQKVSRIWDGSTWSAWKSDTPATDADVDLSSYLLSNYRGTLMLYRRGGQWIFNYSAGGLGTFPNGVGTTINTALPEEFRPMANTNGLIRFTAGHSGSCVITTAGIITLTNQTGAERATANAQAVWPAPL